MNCIIVDEALSIIIPARDEARSVQPILRALRAQFPAAEILLVDNGSSDDTAALAAQIEHVRVIKEPRAGKGHAMRAGAYAARGEFLLFHDADTEYEIRDALTVVNEAREQGGCVIGVRRVSFERFNWSSWMANRLIQVLLKWRFDTLVPDVLSGTRCLCKRDFLALGVRAAGFGIETEMAVACLKNGIPLRTADVRYTPRSRNKGKKIRGCHLFSLIWRAIA